LQQYLNSTNAQNVVLNTECTEVKSGGNKRALLATEVSTTANSAAARSSHKVHADALHTCTPQQLLTGRPCQVEASILGSHNIGWCER
jgi:hypothetical protein